MIELDDRLATLRRHTRAWSDDLRAHALDADREPGTPRALDSAAVSYLRRTTIPPQFNDDPPVLDGHRFDGMTAIERVVAGEELARGDAGTLLAAPGPALCGVLVSRLGDSEQQEGFFARAQEGTLWTAFALTEPTGGSDAGRLATTLAATGDGHRLDGTKRYVGNAARARVAAVFARNGPGPLSVTAVLVDTTDPGYAATPLPMIGLRAAQLCAVTLDGVAVAERDVLGRHLSASAAGMWAATQTFNQLRPGVAAIGLGIARAALDYVSANRRSLRCAERIRVDGLEADLHAARRLLYAAAYAVDANPRNGHAGSAAKARAAAVAEDATLAALALFGAGARLEHPLLDKLARDARGVEFMEGTRNIQRLNASQGVINGRFGR
ncbi:acyl-CoA dehydrogenase family protein [Micromonospora sp. CPCC 205539]|uniref:acyl-CoA dehydrogenase family protein n=1 Tax=Micromonospora sp. CPCC 205539 TaxID=3122408 RepID=UPI002FEF3866